MTLNKNPEQMASYKIDDLFEATGWDVQDKNKTNLNIGDGQAARPGACNGWDFWKYEQAPGDWVELDNLRK
jgi:type I site-specific restriction endonuclease